MVSIIVVHYKTPNIAIKCLKSVEDINYSNKKVTLVDTGSPEEHILQIQESNPDINIIRTSNEGYGAALNKGIIESRANYYLLLNSDIIVSPNIISKIIEPVNNKSNIGICSPKILFKKPKNTLQYAGNTGFNRYTCRSNNIGYGEKDYGQYDSFYTTELGHGAALFITNSVVEEVGLFDEEYFLYFEEHDFTLRAKKDGFKVLYQGLTQVIHMESASVGKSSPLKSFYMSRNRIMFIKKNFSGLSYLTSILVFWFLALPKQLLKHAICADKELFLATLRGAFWHLQWNKTEPYRPD